ncbi:MAG: hypothetical protein JXR05_12070 [Flavobacteriaceae bacterium]
MVTTFYILLGLALWHFAYESVIAPSIRFELRFKYFKLRDELRCINFQELSKEGKKAVDTLDELICYLINSNSSITFGNYMLLKKNKSDEEILENSNSFDTILKEADNNRIIEIEKELRGLASKALLVNHGSWGLYLAIPITLLFVTFIFKAYYTSLKNFIARITVSLLYNKELFQNSLRTI